MPRYARSLSLSLTELYGIQQVVRAVVRDFSNSSRHTIVRMSDPVGLYQNDPYYHCQYQCSKLSNTDTNLGISQFWIDWMWQTGGSAPIHGMTTLMMVTQIESLQSLLYSTLQNKT